MPTRKSEEWRFASVNAITLDGFRLPGPVSDGERTELRARSNALPDVAGKIVFADDHLAEHAELEQELLDKGVIWMPLERAVVEHEELLKKHFMAQPIKLGSEKFSALHGALCRAGTFLYVPKNVEIELPLIAYHWASEANCAIFPHTLVIAEDHSKVTLVDFFGSRDKENRNFICGVNDLYAGAGAKLTYICAQDWGRESLAFQLNSTQSFRDSFITSLNPNIVQGQRVGDHVHLVFRQIPLLRPFLRQKQNLLIGIADARFYPNQGAHQHAGEIRNGSEGSVG